MLPHAARVWGGLALGATLLDIWCDRGEPNGDTITENVRSVFHTDTRIGKTAFTLALATGTGWLYKHITKEIGT